MTRSSERMTKDEFRALDAAAETAGDSEGRRAGEQRARRFFSEDLQRAREQADWLLQGLEIDSDEARALIAEATDEAESGVGDLLRKVLGREWGEVDSEDALEDALDTYAMYHWCAAREAMERAARARTDREPLPLMMRRAAAGKQN